MSGDPRTDALVPDPRFRDQLAEIIGHRGGAAARRCKSYDGGACNCPAGRTAAEIEAFVAAEVEARVQAAANQRMTKVLELADVAEGMGITVFANRLRAAALASLAPVPPDANGGEER